MSDSFLFDRFNLPMAAGVYFEYADVISGIPPIGSSERITEDGAIRLIEGPVDIIRVTE